MKKEKTMDDTAMVKEIVQKRVNSIFRELNSKKLSSKLEIHNNITCNRPLSEKTIKDFNGKAVSSKMLDDLEYLLMSSEYVSAVVRERTTNATEFSDELYVYLYDNNEVLIHSLDSTNINVLEMVEYK